MVIESIVATLALSVASSGEIVRQQAKDPPTIQSINKSSLSPRQKREALHWYAVGRSKKGAACTAASRIVFDAASHQRLQSNAYQAWLGMKASCSLQPPIGEWRLDGFTIRNQSGAWWPHMLASWGRLDGEAGTDISKKKLQSLSRQVMRAVVPSEDGLILPTLAPHLQGGQTAWTSAMTQTAAARAVYRLEKKHVKLPEGLSHTQLLKPLWTQNLVQSGRPRLYSDQPALFVGNAHAWTVLATGSIDSSSSLSKRLRKTFYEELPQYTPRGWSKYSAHGSWSNPHYHALMQQFLATLCSKQHSGQACSAAKRLRYQQTQPLLLTPKISIFHGKYVVQINSNMPGSVSIATKKGKTFDRQKVKTALTVGKITVTLPRVKKRSLIIDAHAVNGRTSKIQMPLQSKP